MDDVVLGRRGDLGLDRLTGVLHAHAGQPAGNSTLSSLGPTRPPRRMSKAPSCRPKILGAVSGSLGSRPALGGSGRGSAAAGGRGAAGLTRTN